MASRSRRSPKKKNPVPRLSWTIGEFCGAVGISHSTYKRWRAEGKGPKEMRFSERVVRISPAAAEKWMQKRAAANRSGANAT